MRPLSFLALLLVSGGCAHQKPCVALPPPTVEKMACAVDPDSNDEQIGLVCSTPSMKKFFSGVHELQQWADETYGVCSK